MHGCCAALVLRLLRVTPLCAIPEERSTRNVYFVFGGVVASAGGGDGPLTRSRRRSELGVLRAFHEMSLVVVFLGEQPLPQQKESNCSLVLSKRSNVDVRRCYRAIFYFRGALREEGVASCLLLSDNNRFTVPLVGASLSFLPLLSRSLSLFISPPPFPPCPSPSRPCRYARVYGLETTAMHENEYTPPSLARLCSVFLFHVHLSRWSSVHPGKDSRCWISRGGSR